MEHAYVKRIRDLREDHDKTQQEIVDMLGTSQTMYARYERGANELPLRHLVKLFRALRNLCLRRQSCPSSRRFFRRTRLMCRSKSPLSISSASTYCMKVGTVQE